MATFRYEISIWDFNLTTKQISSLCYFLLWIANNLYKMFRFYEIIGNVTSQDSLANSAVTPRGSSSSSSWSAPLLPPTTPPPLGLLDFLTGLGRRIGLGSSHSRSSVMSSKPRLATLSASPGSPYTSGDQSKKNRHKLSALSKKKVKKIY